MGSLRPPHIFIYHILTVEHCELYCPLILLAMFVHHKRYQKQSDSHQGNYHVLRRILMIFLCELPSLCETKEDNGNTY